MPAIVSLMRDIEMANDQKVIVPVQGLSIPFACVGSGDPVRVLHLYTTNTLDILLKHLLLRHMYNLLLPMLICYVLKPYALRLPTGGCSLVKC